MKEQKYEKMGYVKTNLINLQGFSFKWRSLLYYNQTKTLMEQQLPEGNRRPSDELSALTYSSCFLPGDCPNGRATAKAFLHITRGDKKISRDHHTYVISRHSITRRLPLES
ncbi:MAG: hypothetical protein AB2L14_34265 [Candidatus Xenobiia bacterium LiM19]